jgi:hypothetical protein
MEGSVAKTDGWRLKQIRSNLLKNAVVTFPSKSGLLSSQKLIGFPSKTLIKSSDKFGSQFSTRLWTFPGLTSRQTRCIPT